MKINWQTKKLGEVLKLEYGKPLLESHRKDSGLYPVYGANGIKAFSDKFYFDKPSIIVGRKGSAGEVNLTENKFWPLDVTYFVTFDIKKYDLKFLYNLLIMLDLPKLAKGVKPGINRNDVCSIEVSVPPLPAQRRIVKILDEVFEKIARAKENAEKNLKNARELFELYLQSVFANQEKSWKKKKLGEVCAGVQYGTSAKSNDTGKVAVLRMGNIQDGKLVWGNLVFTDNDEEIKKYSLKYNDVLFNRTNSAELVGKTATYKGEQPAIFAGYLIRINRKERLIDADFLNYYLNCKKTRKYGFSVMTSSVNQANINGTKLKEYPIMLPPLTEQQRIVSRLDALAAETKKLETIYKQKLTNLEELKKSVLKKAFAGEL